VASADFFLRRLTWPVDRLGNMANGRFSRSLASASINMR